MAKLKPTLNKADLDLVEKRMEKKFPTRDQLDYKLENQKEDIFDRMDEKFAKFKDELYDKLDPILKEVLANREERTIIAHHLSDLRSRVEKIEKHLNL